MHRHVCVHTIAPLTVIAMPSHFFLLSAFLFAQLADAFKAFEPNCTAPHDHVTWVSPPSIRGTMGIIFSSFSVLLICTWAIQHLSVPAQKTHFWRHKKVSDATYSAFLDDARFNYTKLKWMILTFLASEYILAKALSELLAAHDSRRQFTEWRAAQKLSKQYTGLLGTYDPLKQSDQQEWTITHGYFANMGGFILRFDVEAVKLPLEPHKPDKFERSLFKRNPDNDPPYMAQDLVEAEAQELRQCHQGAPCENHPDVLGANNDGSSEEVWSGPEPQCASEVTNSESHPLLEVVVDRQATTTSTESIHRPARTSEDFAIPTPATLVNQSEISSTPTPTSLVNRHGYPMNSTPTTALSNHQFPFPAENTHINNGSDHELHPLNPTISVDSHEHHESHPTTPVHKEKERLLPHKKWRATWALSSMQMLYAIREGIIPIPSTTAEDLNDRSKGDALVKGLAVLHITWLVIQILARGVEGLAITQLEIMVLSFSACAIVTYFLLWHKPQDVKTPAYIDIPGTLTREQIVQLAARSPVATLMVRQFWLHGVAIRAMADNIFPWTPGIKFRIPYFMKDHVYLNPHLIGIGGGGALFGGIHVAAWNFTFPTPVERLLWRISAAYLVSVPLVSTIIYCFVLRFTRKETKESDNENDRILRPIGRVAVPLYLLARLYLLAEVFRCLAYPPPSAFQDVGWPSIIPHIN